MTDPALIPADVVRTVPDGEVVYGMQLPIQSQSTLYVADWEKEAGPASWPASPGWRTKRASSTSACATTPPSRAAWPKPWARSGTTRRRPWAGWPR